MEVLSVVVRNGSAAILDRVVSLLRRRCFPVTSLQFGPYGNGDQQEIRFTLATEDPRKVRQTLSQLRKLPDVLSVDTVTLEEGASKPAPVAPEVPAAAHEQLSLDCTAGEALVRALAAEGADVVFGYPGGAILPVYDALLASPLRHVLTRHEQAAVHAAEGYAKATGRVGVVIATSGPGATNLVTGLLDAFMDSVPLVAITGQVPRSLMGRDSFQEADVLGLTMAATKHNYLVTDPAQLLPTVREAFHLARSGRPGPVLIDIPKDVGYAKVHYEYPPALPAYLTAPAPLPPFAAVEEAAELLCDAERPLIICGGGVSASEGAPEQLAAISEALQAPVVATLHGLGGISGTHPLYIGMLGMHGLYAANMAAQHSDVILAAGMRFDDRVTGKLERFAPHARVIHIEIDEAEIGKNVAPLVSLKGDAALVLQTLKNTLATKNSEPARTKHWLEKIKAWHHRHPVWVERRRQFRVPVIEPSVLEQVAAADQGAALAPAKPLRAEDVIRAIQVVFGPESLVVTDVGQHQMWAAHFCLRTRPRTFITSGGLGTMGFALPAGMGAWLAGPTSEVVVIAGDGGIQMNIQELATVAAEQIPLRIMVVNNGYLGMVRQWQELFHDRRYSAVDLRPGMPDLVKLAEAYGIRALRVESPAAVPWAVQEAHAHPGPILVEFRVVPEENVYPMVSPGAANDDMLVDGDPVNRE